MNDIIIAIIGSGALGATAGAVVSWILNRRLFQAEVEHTVTQSASLAVDMYRDWVSDLRTRVEELDAARRRAVERFADLEREIVELKSERKEYTARLRMMARVLVVILNLLNGQANASLCSIASPANLSKDDIKFLKRIMDEVVSDVDLSDSASDEQ